MMENRDEFNTYVEYELELDDDNSNDDTKYNAGDVVWFTAQMNCTLFGEKYQQGEEVAICLWKDWDSDDGFGDGGPWGWGGYSSWTLRRLAGNSVTRIVG